MTGRKMWGAHPIQLGGGSSAKHSGGKGKGPGKHHPKHHHNPHKGKHAQPKMWGAKPPSIPGVAHHHPGAPLVAEDVCLCTAEALVASLRIAGWPAANDDAMEFYFRLTDNKERGLDLFEALFEASRNGIAGVKPVSWEYVLAPMPGDISVLRLPSGDRHCVATARRGLFSWGKFIPTKLWTPDCVTEDIVSVRWPK